MNPCIKFAVTAGYTSTYAGNPMLFSSPEGALGLVAADTNTLTSGSFTSAFNFYISDATKTITSSIGYISSITGAYNSLSDERKKKNIEPIADNQQMLDSVDKIQLKLFHFKQQNDNDKKNIGVIAQDLLNSQDENL